MMKVQALATVLALASSVVAGPLNQRSPYTPQGNTTSSSSLLAPTATIDIGTIIGTTTTLASATAPVNKFLGIPFAKTPPERFTPPAPADQLKDPLLTQAWKPACIQQFVGAEPIRNFTESVFNEPPPQESEDCLYINVYAPASLPPPGGRAVLFWIYGGGLQFGDAGNYPYDGSAFAAYQDVILVAGNYRTNVFGFPNSPELAVTGQNLGLLDQRANLDWVQKNIDKFGGDPEKVTIFGESAGAFSVDILLTSFNTSDAPFRGAILESGQVSYGSDLINPAESTNSWSSLVSALNCTPGGDDLACVRAAPATTIQSIIENDDLIFNPVVDNVTLVSQPALARAAGNFAAVPVLAGTNAQEGRVFEVGQTNLTSFLQTTFGTLAPQSIPAIEAAYGPVGNITGVNTDFDIISAIYTDYNFQCGEALFANETSAQGVPTWRYLYNATFPNTVIFPDSGVYHSSEIVQVFGTYSGGTVNPNTPAPLGLQQTQLPPTAQQVALSEYMNGAWAQFAKDPMNGPGWTPLGRFTEALGILGQDGSSGVTVVDPQVVSAVCPLFYPAYIAAAGGVVLPGLNVTM